MAIDRDLSAPLDQRRVQTRLGGAGKKLSYLTTHDVKRTANRIFGYDGWSYVVEDLISLGEEPFKNSKGREGLRVGYRAIVTVTIGDVKRGDVGYGDAMEYNASRITPHELAAKEAVSDALKRCLSSWGDQFGLVLYGADPAPQPVVDEFSDSPRSVGNHAGSSSASPSTATATTPGGSSATPPGRADTAGVVLAPSDGPDATKPTGAGPVLEPSGDELTEADYAATDALMDAEHKRAHETANTAELKLDPAARKVINADQAKKFKELAKGYGITGPQALVIIREQTGKKNLGLVERYQFDALLAEVEACGRGVSA